MNDERFEQAAAAILRASAVDVDAATQARLQHARRAAMGAWPRRRSASGEPVRAAVHAVGPAFAVAATAVLAVALWLGTGSDRMGGGPTTLPPEAATAPGASTSDVDFLMTDTNTNMEMIQHLEFFSWLDADRSDDELRAELEAVSPTGA